MTFYNGAVFLCIATGGRMVVFCEVQRRLARQQSLGISN
jgi:hypothetical protein